MGEVKHINGKRVATPEYRSWQMMKNRCLNKKAADYAYYGGRGIQVCAEWAASFTRFLEDMGRRLDPALTLERRDVDGNYTPDNCYWATRKEQSRNRKYAKTQSWKLAEILGVASNTAMHYINQVRAKDRGNTNWFELSAALEKRVRDFLAGEANV